MHLRLLVIVQEPRPSELGWCNSDCSSTIGRVSLRMKAHADAGTIAD